MKKEVFKILPNHCCYEISNKGRVRNITTGKFMKLREYDLVNIFNNKGKYTTLSVKKWKKEIFGE